MKSYLKVLRSSPKRQSLDSVRAYDSVPKIVLDDDRLSTDSIGSNSSEIVLFIDYTSDNTRVSYIHVHDGQLPDSTNVKHIVDWPGQSSLNRILPTTEVMLIPSNNLNGNFGKKIFSLKDNTNHNKQFLEHTRRGGGGVYYEYYTFKKSKRNIIWYIHRQEKVENKSTCTSYNHEKKELKIAQNNFDLCVSGIESASVTSKEQALSPSNTSGEKSNSLYRFTVTQQRISFPEFSTMYFEYIISFLHNHLHSKIGVGDVRFRYCITRDSFAESDGFKLLDEDIHNIASECGIISNDTHRLHNLLLVLERVEAMAIYCRKLINSIDTNNRTSDLGFMQLQLTTDRCLLLINRVPFYANKDDKRQDKESWGAIYKYSKSATFPFNFMDNTCENLWTHIQRHQHKLLKRCEQHRKSDLFFDSKNMSVFNKLLRVYFRTATLDLLDGDKVHKIYTCNNGQEGDCCCVLIANMDILQFGLIPAINRLVLKIQSRILNEHLLQELDISNIFVMGTILFCRYQSDYKFLEELLLVNLKKMNLSRLNGGFTLHRNIKFPQVTKVDGKENGKRQTVYHNVINYEEDQEVLARIALNGSIMYGLNPKNQMFERFATKTYAVCLEIRSIPSGIGLKDYHGEVLNSNESIDVEEFVDDNEVDGDFEPNDTDVSFEGEKLLKGTGYVPNNEGGHVACSKHIFNGNEHFCKSPYVTCKQLGISTKVTSDTVIPIIRKGTLLQSLELIEEEINTSFSIFDFPKKLRVGMILYTLDDDDGSDWDIKRLRDLKGVIFHVFLLDCMRSTYPVIFKTRPSQTGSYDFWVEYDENSKKGPFNIHESILLKTNYK
ncbi:unnamed protein product [Mucor hiemalis]